MGEVRPAGDALTRTVEETDLVVEYRDRVAIVWFNRPERLNAFRAVTFEALDRVLRGLLADPEVLAVILTGRGRAFCAGEDLDEMGAEAAAGFGVASAHRQLHQLQQLTRMLLGAGKPTAAALNGPAVGLGAELPLACDLRLASTTAYLLFPEARRGMLQTNAAFHRLPRMVGAGRAFEWMATGRRVTSEEALAAGLVNARVAPDDLIPATLAWIGRALDHAGG